MLADVGDLGVGVGLRRELVAELLLPDSGFDFVEAITEDYLTADAEQRAILDRIAERYPVVLHGLSLNIGGVDALDEAYLRDVRDLAEAVGARWVSDHLCWTGVDGVRTHELLPLPLTSESLAHVIERVRVTQDVLGQPLVLENAAAYLGFEESTMSEPEFFTGLVEATGCRLLLDVNNVHVSASNVGFDPRGYVDALPSGAVVQIHLAGSQDLGAFLLDTHDDRVSEPVWDLYAQACRRFGPVSTSFEWDSGVPSLDVFREELRKAVAVRLQSGPRTAPRTLAESQRALQRRILDGRTQQSVPMGETGLRRLSHDEGVAVYGNTYRAQHLDCLRSAHPALGELLGVDFDSLALGYLASPDGRAGDPDEFVNRFAGWVDDAFRDRPGAAVVRDVLALESAIARLRDGAERLICLSSPSGVRDVAIRAGVVSTWTGRPAREVTLVRRGPEVHAEFGVA
jgi:uncharacterized protein